MSTSIPPLNPANVQGDILVGLPKKVQHYVFFTIGNDVAEFRRRLGELIPLITTTAQVLDDHTKIAANKKAARDSGKAPQLLKLSGVNIAFSHHAFVKLGITEDIGDSAFDKGQLADAMNLGDPGKMVGSSFDPESWIPAFKTEIDGVIIISGDSEPTIAATQAIVDGIFNIGTPQETLHEVIVLKGIVRPGAEKGHEHFGFLDNISQPAVQDFDTKPNPGQETVGQGVILCGRANDIDLNNNNQPIVRPPWALDGSFIALRYYTQLVPELNTFLKQNPIKAPNLTPAQGSELLGARLFGRWKSGAPIDLFPTQDNPAAGADPLQNNNFRYAFPDDATTQDRCPFAAHTRKTNPRADLEDDLPGGPAPTATENRRIIRRGIPFGPEVTRAEAALGKTQHDRGLIFAAYQSNIVQGFQFVQHSWANTTTFPPKSPVIPGFDPVIGQTNDDEIRTLVGTDPNNQSASLSLPAEWVVPKGGEYFFSPSIPALRSKFAL